MEKLITQLAKQLLVLGMGLTWTIAAYPQELLDPHTQPQFVNPLPVPSVIDARNGGVFNMGISQFNQWLGLVNPVTQEPMTTKVWGYNGSYPGPTIVAKKDVPIDVFWHNNLVDGNGMPLPHLLPIDPSVHWALEEFTNWQSYGIPVVTHLHGGHTESASDGLPDAWFTPGFALRGHGFVKGDIAPYHYSNSQEAATIWYHDHALGITRLNVYAGLAGYYLLTDNNEINLQNSGSLPAAPYDLGLAIQDRMFTKDGQLFYPSTPETDDDNGGPNPSILPEFFGNFILVNGKTWPVLEVEPRQYRFRVLNGSDSRFYDLSLSGNQGFRQIGTDNGFLASPVSLTQLLIGPGERKDIIIDFSQPALWGQTIIVRNNAKTPFPKGVAVDPQTTGRIMAFRVNQPLNQNYPLTSVPATLRPPVVPLQTTLPARKLVLFEAEDEFDRLKPMLGTVENGVMNFHDPITENPALNSTEIWEIYNATVDAHPIHLHMVSSQLINRQRFMANVDEHTGATTDIRLLGQPRPPAPEEQAWKDTWITYPGEVTRLIAKFDIEGLYAWHCHILSHEDHEMMRPFYVGQMEQFVKAGKRPVNATPDIERQLQLQAIPNPFSTQFTIRFQLPATAAVIVNMYDAKGTLVKKVQNAAMNKGFQQLNLDGANMANGIYYCEVIINDQRIMRKMILQK
jgi:spore coat protein A